jgi:hypothetical protein
MSAATVSPSRGHPHGATALDGIHHHYLGAALHALWVYARAAFEVVILGEYGTEAGVHRA